MTEQVRIFILFLIINGVIVCTYFLWGVLHSSESGQWKGYLFKAEVMLFCPGIGPLFFLAGNLIHLLCFKNQVDLEDVIFSKERVKTHKRADVEAEGNLVPIEEALVVSDKSSQRSLLLKVVRGDIQNSLASISLALNSDDSETAHYAASVLQEALNDFRQKVQELYAHMKEDEENSGEYACLMLKYMNHVLCQNVFDELEQKKYVGMMEEAGENLYQKDRDRLTGKYIEWICMRLLQIEDFERSYVWCERSKEMYPEVLSTYTNQLKLYFTIQDKKNFFLVLNTLKKSDIVIDKDTLELIRAFYETDDKVIRDKKIEAVITESAVTECILRKDEKPESSETESLPVTETAGSTDRKTEPKVTVIKKRNQIKYNIWIYAGLGAAVGAGYLIIRRKKRIRKER